MVTFAKFYFTNTNILHDLTNFPPTKVSLRMVAIWEAKHIKLWC